MRAYEYATREAWAILARYREDGSVEAPDLEMILNISQRIHDPDFDAILKAQAKHLEAREAASKPVDGIAQINVIGSIFRYANLFTDVSGGATISGLQADLRAAVEDRSVRAILLNIDSPGGQVDGVSDFADAVRAASKVKPVVAYSDGVMASGAYWIGSAASRMLVSDTAALGSLGVVANVRQPDKQKGEYEFVSSVSPKKRPNVESDSGKAQVQALVDSIAQVFVSKVAAYRGVSIEKVASEFGQGGVLIGADAVAAGMADQVATRDSVFANILPRERMYSLGALSAANHSQKKRSKGMDVEFTAEQTAAVMQQIEAACTGARAEARKAERTRIAAIMDSPEAEGREAMARTLALTMDMSPEDAAKIMATAPKATAAVTSEFSAQMARVVNPKVGVDADASEPIELTPDEEINAAAKRILSAGR